MGRASGHREKPAGEGAEVTGPGPCGASPAPSASPVSGVSGAAWGAQAEADVGAQAEADVGRGGQRLMWGARPEADVDLACFWRLAPRTDPAWLGLKPNRRPGWLPGRGLALAVGQKHGRQRSALSLARAAAARA